ATGEGALLPLHVVERGAVAVRLALVVARPLDAEALRHLLPVLAVLGDGVLVEAHLPEVAVLRLVETLRARRVAEALLVGLDVVVEEAALDLAPVLEPGPLLL